MSRILPLPRRCRRAIRALAAFGLALLAATTAQALQLAYEPTGLGWSADEVQLASQDSLLATVDSARQRGLLGCRQHCERLHGIFDRLLVQARQQTARARNLPWTLTVVRLPDVDAFALPDGQVVVSETLITGQQLGDEALAFVIAHEMAHSLLEHERQILSFGRLLLARDVWRSVADMYVEMAFNPAFARSLEPATFQAEFEADELGLLLAAAAGYEPQRQLQFMRQEARLDAARQIVPTHPPFVQRLRQLELRLPLAARLHAAQAQGRR